MPCPETLYLSRPREINEDLLEIMEELTRNITVNPTPSNNDEVAAWIDFVNLTTRLKNLTNLKLR